MAAHSAAGRLLPGMLSAVLLCMPALASAAAPGTSIASAHKKLKEWDRSAPREGLTTLQFNAAIASQYRALAGAPLDAAQLRALSDKALLSAHEAAGLVAFYTSDAGHAAELAASGAELVRRGKATRSQIEDVHQKLIAARLFGAALQWRGRHGLGESNATMTADDTVGAGSAGPTVLAFTGQDGPMLRKPFPLRGKQIIALTHPLCHFSYHALGAIAGDAALGARMQTFMTLLVPQRAESDMRVFKAWNTLNPEFAYKLAYQASEWPMIAEWATPNFYFMRDGVVVDMVQGWPRDGSRMAELRAALERLEQAP